MNDETMTLARALAAHPRWQWMDGMLSSGGRVVVDTSGAPGAHSRTAWLPLAVRVSTGHYPDLDDPATQGCLMAMLGDSLISLERRASGPSDWYAFFWGADNRLTRTPEEGTRGETIARAVLRLWGSTDA